MQAATELLAGMVKSLFSFGVLSSILNVLSIINPMALCSRCLLLSMAKVVKLLVTCVAGLLLRSPPKRVSFLHAHFQEVFRPLECLELVRLTVSDRHQRRGIAQALLRAVEGHALSLGLKTIYLTTLTQMHSAFAFYSKNHFTLLAKELISSEGLPFSHSVFDFEVAHFIRDIKPQQE